MTAEEVAIEIARILLENEIAYLAHQKKVAASTGQSETAATQETLTKRQSAEIVPDETTN